MDNQATIKDSIDSISKLNKDNTEWIYLYS